MAKLIGTAPNQVPTNADLGSLAYIDKDNFDANISELTLGALSREITDTAVDIFVYDTRKDSDGGAWRKRTQHTSWYNEGASATRGSRKEFPAVAVIVAESTQVTIYDGDDPDLPMWRVFSVIGALLEGTVRAVTAKNAMIISGCQYDAYWASLIEDRYYEVSDSGTYKPHMAIADATYSGRVQLNTQGLVNRSVNDIAVTVLPNAPIDAATGLPVPTIAVGTDGGVSVIKDDGTVVDITNTNTYRDDVEFVNFTPDNNILIQTGPSGTERMLYVSTLPTADVSSSSWEGISTVTEYYEERSGASPDLYLVGDSATGLRASTATNKENERVVGGTSGLNTIEANTATPTEGMVAYTTSDYATGWMNGDIKLATLSDTDDTDVTGSNLISGDAASDDTNSTGSWVNSGMATFESSTTQVYSGTYSIHVLANSNGDAIYRNFTVETGKTYTFTAAVYQASASQYRIGIGTGGTDFTYYNSGDVTSHNGSWKIHSVTFTATGTSANILFSEVTPADSCDLYIDALSVRLAEEDRSVNGNGLQVFGTVTKNPVNSGADLVGYSGFSASNYLEQPYNSDLDFSGDFSIQTWMYIPSDTTAAPYHYSYSLDQDEGILALYVAGSGLRTYTRENGGNWNYTQSSVPLNSWIHLTHQRKSGIVSTFVNGSLTGSYTHTADLTRSGNFIRLGRRTEPSQTVTYWRGSLALFRISATAPSPEQIKKIYEDEKVLFQENAQATLYGSSDAVTALAYDDSTEILSVGTSAGRSDFQGLRRVNNTTNAVGAAISASNGMIVEE